MQPNELEEDYLEKTMNSGEVMTLTKIINGFDVDQWNADGANRWHRFYSNYEDAKVEYDRWN